MPKKKEIDSPKLIQMIKDQTDQKEIMEAFDFKTSSQLKIAYANALMELGEAPEIKTTRKAAAEKPKNEIKISKRGSLVVPKPMIDTLGFDIGDTFQVRKTKAGISLKRM